MQKISIILLLAIASVNISAQNSNYETWAKQKRAQYDQWKKMRSEIVSRLPDNPEADKISSFIDAGFESVQTGVSVPEQPASPAKKRKVRVVIAGVAGYQDCCNQRELQERDNCSISCLNYTDDDAYKIYAFYKSPEGGSLPDAQIRLLIDEEATQENVIKALNEVFSKAEKDDVVVFYFSGHGAKNAFVAQNFHYHANSSHYSGLLFHEEIGQIFKKSPAKHKYIIADACHSGTMTEQAGNYYDKFDETKQGFAMLLSSMSEEYSEENSGIRQGIFSYYLIKGLKGEADVNRDQVVSVTELYDYVHENVVKNTNGRQNPVLFGKYDEKLPIAVIGE
jgi:hypothetical protein